VAKVFDLGEKRNGRREYSSSSQNRSHNHHRGGEGPRLKDLPLTERLEIHKKKMATLGKELRRLETEEARLSAKLSNFGDNDSELLAAAVLDETVVCLGCGEEQMIFEKGLVPSRNVIMATAIAAGREIPQDGDYWSRFSHLESKDLFRFVSCPSCQKQAEQAIQKNLPGLGLAGKDDRDERVYRPKNTVQQWADARVKRERKDVERQIKTTGFKLKRCEEDLKDAKSAVENLTREIKERKAAVAAKVKSFSAAFQPN